MNTPARQVGLIPMRQGPWFPGFISSMPIGRPESIRRLSQALASDKLIALIGVRDPEGEVKSVRDLYSIGSLVYVEDAFNRGDGVYLALMRGLCRIKVHSLNTATGTATVVEASDDSSQSPPIESMKRELSERLLVLCQKAKLENCETWIIRQLDGNRSASGMSDLDVILGAALNCLRGAPEIFQPSQQLQALQRWHDVLARPSPEERFQHALAELDGLIESLCVNEISKEN
ncbi:LON peptidase substrate-binding domain-containing protein [Hahella sp. CR1]|uniref:LON peptidase substrate-binding domain-containing protein n=1 Tax=Hahella sp. CR1 TaxID=2992807 RepID=UPI00244344CD|nr:LON peptidase substrate-binding domain-containing protein [Hahella sp. CR1]MDG9669520.1 LON peptidase substrate-binding domain-containing protein [Hahella sp. CR1]